MGFNSFVVQSGGPVGTGFACSLKRMRNSRAILGFTLRPALAEQLGWAGGGAKLAILLGDGDDHGLIRFRKDEAGSATVKLREAGNRKRGGDYYAISLGHIPQFVNRSEERKWVQFEQLDDGWIEVVLPKWADETGAARHRAAVAVATLPTPPRPSGAAITRTLMGDPPPGRSALAQRGAPAPTRGQLREQAIDREDSEYASSEEARRIRNDEQADALARYATVFGLTKTEARYLAALAGSGGKLFTKERLLEVGHDEAENIDLKSVDVYVHKLRKKLKASMLDLETVHGQGYRMLPEMAKRVLAVIADAGPSRDDDEAELAALEESA